MTGKILLITEMESDLSILQSTFSDTDVLLESDGLRALNLIREQPDIDLILIDWNSHSANRFDLLGELKKIPRKPGIRIILLTSDEETLTNIPNLQAGDVDFIRRPLSPQTLRMRIGLHLELIRIQRLYNQIELDHTRMFDTLFNQTPIGVALSHEENASSNYETQVMFNAQYQRITGRTREELIELGWRQITHPDDRCKEEALYNRFRAGEIDRYTIEKRIVRPDGSIVWTDVIVARFRFFENMTIDSICLVQDITDRKDMEAALLESERSKDVLLSSIPGLAYRCDYDRFWTMRFISEGCYDLTGYKPESLLNNRDLSFNDVIAPKYRKIIWAEWERELKSHTPFKHEYEIITATGQRKWVLEMGQGVFDSAGKVQALEGIIVDISDRKEQEMQLKRVADVDPLTKLYNRRYLETILKSAAKAKNYTKRALVFVSLRKINNISLTYGYDFCEQIMLELATGLSGLTNARTQLFQISFERFAFYIRKYESEDELKAFSQKVLNLIDSIQILRTVGCGIGIEQFHSYHCVPENIIKNASTAAERSDMDENFAYRFFNSEMEAAIKRETDVKEAMIRLVDGSPDERLYLQFQPILNLKTNTVTEFEALARFESKSIGSVSPLEFISIAEETQLIVPLGRRIMDQACAFQRRLQDAGHQNIRTFVNISAIQLLRSDFIADSMMFANKHGVSPESLGLEVTESAFADNFTAINDILDKLMKLGVRTAIDDFGTGYSSLARERDMKISILKIDKYFINGLLNQEREKTVTQDIIAMAHRMGHAVVAEGVEYEEQLQYLRDYGCDMIQGYLFSKPLNEDEAIRFAAKFG
ncbi:MAG TPA: EAL domain-containing protein [Candidatus Limiplasma sp.]|nr:EAL domain-containing protein [Candidatus Limiplasma sp.]HRX07656.1 EAL domain-containing protein [Candidatus Limiplasma sp.]